MNNTNYFLDYFENLNYYLVKVDPDELSNIANLVLQTNIKKKKIIVVGNGGSAAIASHVTVDFTKAAKIRAINFNEADLLTCFSNDYGYENWVAKALEFYADEGDLVFLISSSGRSLNIINGAKKAKNMNLHLVTLSGFGKDNPLSKIGDYNLCVESTSYNIVETTHQVWLLAIIDYLIEN